METISRLWMRQYANERLYAKHIINIPLDIIRQHFIFSYATTCHSFQGHSVKERITIHDYTHFHATRNWLYVAITRCTDLNNVYFYKPKEEEKTINTKPYEIYFKSKIQGYKQQDKAAGRAIDKDKYITSEWFIERLNDICPSCNEDFKFKFTNGKITDSDITADRLNNDISHEIDNCRICCQLCNNTKR